MPLGIGARKTCQWLWEAIPQEYRPGHCFTDFLSVSASVIPEEQHTAGGKETGETAHVERWNNTLRQRLARFVRMTLSFSRVRGDARGVSSALSLSLQSRPSSPSQMSHYPLLRAAASVCIEVRRPGQSHLILGTGFSSCIITSRLTKLCYVYALFKALENVDAIALVKRPLRLDILIYS
jgi:hypothetical protein